MSIQKKVLALAIALSCSSAMSTTVFAAETSAEEVMPLATGLISRYTLNGTYGYNTLMINASTIGSAEMAKIGIVDIVVQHSSDKVNWVDEVSVSDTINENGYACAGLQFRSASQYNTDYISGVWSPDYSYESGVVVAGN